MRNYREHLIKSGTSIRSALEQLNILSNDAILFVVDEDDILIGSLTDGDVRRGLIKGIAIDDKVNIIIQNSPRYIKKGESDIQKVIEYREGNFRIIPILDRDNRVVNVINFREIRSYLPVDALIMAGGRGERLRPLTDNTPKPLLNVGNKPIIEHNVDRLKDFGIDDIWISLRYLGEQIESYFEDGSEKSIRIKYVYENNALGTIGALTLLEDLVHDTILVMNSDLLTNINFEEFYLYFMQQNADFSVACIPYQVNIPYAVMETKDNIVTGFKEKPSYTHYSNAGIYLMKRDVIDLIPPSTLFNATDLMELLLAQNKKVVSYPLVGYWLDIGKHDDYKKAQEDIKHLAF